MDSALIIYGIGFLAQLFFSARIIVQWIKAEKTKTMASPTAFWVLSILGSWLFFLYGWLRDDFSIVLGQFISFYIYLWNLNLKGVWTRLPWLLRAFLFLTPVVIAGLMLRDAQALVQSFFRNKDLPLGLVIFGSAGQIIFNLRFIYQWFYSLRTRESALPMGFWLISLVGSGVIIAYGVYRLDPVLILGQSFGFAAYCRNLIIGRNRKHD